MNSLSLIVPVCNAEKSIKESLINYYNFFSKEFEDLEIIVVCNACTDKTPEICRNLTKTIPLKIIETKKKGKGNALVIGFNNAKFEIMGFIDADNPFNLDKILKMISLLDHSDVAIATKYLKWQARIQDSQMRRFLSLGAQLISMIFFSMNFRDTQAGAKFFKKEVWEKIDTNFTCIGFDFDIEFLYKVRKNKFKIAEYYIPFKYEKFSTVRLRYLPPMIGRLLKLRFLK